MKDRGKDRGRIRVRIRVRIGVRGRISVSTPPGRTFATKIRGRIGEE